MKTPSELNFRMPAEWEPHQGTWLTWPRPDGISFPDRYDQVLPVLSRFIKELVKVEEVYVNVWDEAMEARARRSLAAAKVPTDRVRFYPFPAYEPWCRDHGPIFLVRDLPTHRDRAVVDWGYNAWGEKYPPYDLDDAVPQHVAKLRNLPLYSPKMVLEGGSIEVNGAGTLLTTESCLLNPNRNPELSRTEIEGMLREYLGITKILWLGDGLSGDDTDGHIDTLARFVNATTVVTGFEEDIQDANYHFLQENWRRLRMSRDQDERLFRVVKLPMPRMIERHGQRLPATYLNFYVANEVVIVPTFRDANDAKALALLRQEFPDRRVVGLDSLELIWGLGSFHCLSQQEPA